jgi:proteasome lid subunit RPN8/RPN11
MNDPQPGAPGPYAAADLVIEAAALQAIHAAARACAAETMGLLASPPRAGGTHAVTAALPLPAACSPCSAEASPKAIMQACAELAANGLVPRGIYHSHPAAVYESGTDQASLRRIAPSIAAHNWERPARAPQPPAVSGPAQALLPGADTVVFTLRGKHLLELAAYQPARWARVSVDFDPSRQCPQAILTPRRLTLSSAGVQLALELPPGASVVSAAIDTPGARLGYAFSLIVNRWGQQQGYAMAVLTADSHTLCEPAPCQIVVADCRTTRPEYSATPAPDADLARTRP